MVMHFARISSLSAAIFNIEPFVSFTIIIRYGTCSIEIQAKMIFIVI